MVRGWLAGVGLTAFTAAAAFAADVPPGRYMPPPRTATYVPFFTWGGFYVGINGGYGFGKSNWTDTVNGASTGDFDVNGAAVGGTLGYNMLWGGFLFGVEGDFDWANIKGTSTNCLTTCETALQWLGTGRGRIGYAFDRFLPYFTGGAAFGNIKASATGFGSTTSTEVGWTAGAGLEYAFFGGFTAKAEYLYIDLGTAKCDAACSGGNPVDVTFRSHLVRGGLNYKF